MYDKLFAGMVLPVRPNMAADGASIRVEEIVTDEVAGEAFFGGYAEDFLADLGFDMMEAAPEQKAAKKVQG
jgi:hypothetical protein